jgi:Zn-dependent protease
MILSVLITVFILVFSAILHEIAHGYVADRLGDPTARLMGRLTLNPKNHIDPVMSIFLPIMLYFASSGTFVFAAAKPVPVDPFNLKEGRKDLAIVSLAGPLTNIVIAIIASFLVKFSFIFGDFGQIIHVFFTVVVQMNLLLAIFNLLPIPPLDGSKIFSIFLPEKEANIYMSLGSIGFMILFFLLMFPIAGFSLMDFVQGVVIFSERLLGL